MFLVTCPPDLTINEEKVVDSITVIKTTKMSNKLTKTGISIAIYNTTRAATNR